MAANDELARGWSLSVTTIHPTIASIVLPAVQGVSRVLTDVKASVVSGGTSSAFTIQALFDAVVVETLGIFGVSVAANDVGMDVWTGKLVAPTGVALTVRFAAAAGASNEQLLVVQGYDI